MAKKEIRRKKEFSFPVAKVFPPANRLAIDLLRLMAGFNDLAFIASWVDAHKQIPEKRGSKVLAAGRWFLQLRLLSSLLHEVLNVLAQAERQAEFRQIERLLPLDARAALAQLRNVRAGGDKAIQKVLKRTRDKTTFHFDRGEFRQGLNRLLSRYGEDCRSTLLAIFGDTQKRLRPHYVLADEVRTEIAFGLTGTEGGREELLAILNLVGALSVFLDGIFETYSENRGLLGEFRPEADVKGS